MNVLIPHPGGAQRIDIHRTQDENPNNSSNATLTRLARILRFCTRQPIGMVFVIGLSAYSKAVPPGEGDKPGEALADETRDIIAAVHRSLHWFTDGKVELWWG